MVYFPILLMEKPEVKVHNLSTTRTLATSPWDLLCAVVTDLSWDPVGTLSQRSSSEVGAQKC